ncbi:MAG: T9SS type A sorting domain-containing protein [Ferruginibacter sp.]|nr:T9SS type A sorting domain-containing protein [Ferruginibacter sp.]
MKKIIFSIITIVFFSNTIAQIPDPCTGAGALQAIDIASPCNCAEAQAGTSCNKSVFATQGLADAAINSYLTTQSGYGQPTIPVAWQDVRSDNMMLNGTGVVKHEFSTEFTTGATDITLNAINICQVKNTCNAMCQDYKIIEKSTGVCGTNLLTPTLITSGLDPAVKYRQYTVSPSTTYIISRTIYYDGTSAGCFTSWTGSDGSASGGAKITAQHWFLWSTTGVLAISDLKLTATQLNNTVMLNWSTLYENNNAKFEIEKSVDGINFIKIENVLSKGNTTTQNNYWIQDNKPNALNYYRIKAIAFDGKVSISATVKLLLKTNNTTIIIAPNPVKETANIVLESKIANTVSFKIINTTGNTVATGNMQLQSGINKISKNISTLVAGTYLFVSEVNGERVSVRFVKE